MTIRLQKFLSQAGVASRRHAEELITAGKISINGRVITKLGATVDEATDQVTYDGKNITIPEQKTYIALHKPLDYISSTSNAQGKSILKLIPEKEKLFPVGRLDKDSTGLILLTNDGEFANHITHPRYGCAKEYFVVLDRDLASQDIKKLERGILMAGKKLQPVKVHSAKNKSARLELKEGMNRQIRRMMGKLGYTVVRLKRIRIGKLELGELKEGQWKKIKKEDVV